MRRTLRCGVLVLLLGMVAEGFWFSPQVGAVGGAFCSPFQNCNRDDDCGQGYCFNRTCHCDADPGYCALRCDDIGMQWPDPNACGPGNPGVTVHMPSGFCRGAGARPRYGGGIISYCNQCVPTPPPPTPTPAPPSTPPCSGATCVFNGGDCSLVTGEARDVDGSPVTVRVYEGASLLNSGTANPSFGINPLLPTPVGPAAVSHTLTAYALDVPRGGSSGPAVQIFTDRVVTCLPPVPTVTLNATSPIAFNGTSTITWNAPTASSCTGIGGSPGWSGVKANSGSFVTPALTGTTTFSIYCTNDGGNGPTVSATAIVNPPPAPVISGVSQPDYCTTNNLLATVHWTAETNNDYQVQVATNATFTALIYDSKNPLVSAPVRWLRWLLRAVGFGDDAEAVVNGQHIIPSAKLTPGTTYFVRVRVRNSPTSPWSPWSANVLSLPGALTTFTTPASAYPVPSISVSPSEIFAGAEVQFSGSSTGNPATWQWNFGDGVFPVTPPGEENKQNPKHIYGAEGSYTVTLTVTSPEGYSCVKQATLSAGKPVPGYREVRPGIQPSPSPRK